MSIPKSLEYPDIDHDAVSGLPIRHDEEFELQRNETARRRQQRSWQAAAADEAGVPEFGPI